MLKERQCVRYVMPGAALVYRKESFFNFGGKFTEDLHPILDISCGGLRFLSQKRLQGNTEVSLNILDPNETSLMVLRGRVVRVSLHQGASYSYQVGVQFRPFGLKKGFNPPESLEKLFDLESLFLGAAEERKPDTPFTRNGSPAA